MIAMFYSLKARMMDTLTAFTSQYGLLLRLVKAVFKNWLGNW